jgi:thiol-disulfide isomerase/thioredoxin
VIDLHPEWCGPCEMLFPTYKSLLTTIDDFDKRVDIVMVKIFMNILKSARTRRFKATRTINSVMRNEVVDMFF